MSDRETFLTNGRAVRDAKLSLSDNQMMMILDTATSWADFNSIRAEWKTYRQALRDYPDAFPDPCTEDDIPTMPLSPTEQAALDAVTPVNPPE